MNVFDFCLVTSLEVYSHTLQVSDDPLGNGPWCDVGTWPAEGRALLFSEFYW